MANRCKLSLQGTSAKAGDVLNLVVTRATPSTVIATLASAAPDTASTSLSQTGKLISFLLTGQPSPQPASLAANQPLLQAPPTAGQALAPLLKQAISESGLFYESHQARWLSGETDAAATLMREPQGRSPAAGTQPPATGAAATAGTTASSAATGTTSPTRRRPGPSPRAKRPRSSAPKRPLPPRHAPRRRFPIDCCRWCTQQLDALATNHYAWRGMAWPGQRVEWDIDDPSGDSAEKTRGRAGGWRSSLRLTLPKLGAVEARLHLTDAGVSLHFVADEGRRRATAARPRRTGEALAQASVPMTGMSVEVTAPGADHGET